MLRFSLLETVRKAIGEANEELLFLVNLSAMHSSRANIVRILPNCELIFSGKFHFLQTYKLIMPSSFTDYNFDITNFLSRA